MATFHVSLTCFSYLLKPIITIHGYQQVAGRNLQSLALSTVVKAPEQRIFWSTLQLQDTRTGSDIDCLFPEMAMNSQQLLH